MGAKSEGLKELAADLEFARDHAVGETKKVVGRGSLNVKKDAQRIIRGASHRGYLPHYPRSITYTVAAGGYTVVGEIGPESSRLQGGLGRLLEYGSQNNAPIPHLGPAVDAEEPRLAQFMEELGVKLMEGRGGPPGPVQDPE